MIEILERIAGKLLFIVAAGLLLALLGWLWRLVWRRLGQAPAPALVNTSASPIINEQLAQLTQCQQIGLDLRARYAPRLDVPVREFDMAADAALRSIDGIVLILDRTRRELVKSQRPLKPERLQELLAYGRQLQELTRLLG